MLQQFYDSTVSLTCNNSNRKALSLSFDSVLIIFVLRLSSARVTRDQFESALLEASR